MEETAKCKMSMVFLQQPEKSVIQEPLCSTLKGYHVEMKCVSAKRDENKHSIKFSQFINKEAFEEIFEKVESVFHYASLLNTSYSLLILINWGILEIFFCD